MSGHPGVVLAVADWLAITANRCDIYGYEPDRVECAVADAILGGS